jgi:hypothetical protein
MTTETFDFNVADISIAPASGPQAGPVASIDLTTGATTNETVCYSTDNTPVNDCGGGGTINCSPRGANATVHIASNQATNLTVRYRACRVGFVGTPEHVDTYGFTPYSHTITIDGNNDFSLSNDAVNFGSCGNRDPAYVSFDANNFYVGAQGPDITNSTIRYFHFYVRSNSGTYSSTSDALPGDAAAFGPQAIPDGGADWHFYWRTDGIPGLGIRQFTGGAWQFPLVSPSASCHPGGTLGNADSYIECSVSRTDLGIGGSASLWIATAIHQHGSAQICAGDGVYMFSPYNGAIWGHLLINMSSAKAPNDASYVFFP